MTYYSRSLSYIDSRYFFLQWEEVDWRYLCTTSLQELPEVSRTWGLFTLTFRSNSSHFISMGIKSIDCEDICWRTCSSSLLLMYFWLSLEYDLGQYLSRVEILDPQATFQIGSCDALKCCDSRSHSVCTSPCANPRLCKWQKPSTP